MCGTNLTLCKISKPSHSDPFRRTPSQDGDAYQPGLNHHQRDSSEFLATEHVVRIMFVGDGYDVFINYEPLQSI